MHSCLYTRGHHSWFWSWISCVFTSSPSYVVKPLQNWFQAIIRDLGGTGKRMALKSLYGHELDDIKILASRYVVAYTHTTLLLGDMMTAKLSELQLWLIQILFNF